MGLSPRVLTRRLDNGVTGAVVTLPEHTHGAVTVHVRAGGCYETAQDAGISHFVEHLLFRGSSRHPTPRAFAQACARTGASINAYTRNDQVVFAANVLPAYVAELIATLADELARPLLSAEVVNAERRVVEAEMALLQDGAKLRAPADIATRDCVPGSRIDRQVIGTPATLATFTLEQVRGHLARHYTGTNVVVVAAGPFGEEVLGYIADAFAALPIGSPAEPIPEERPAQPTPPMRTIAYPGDPHVRLLFEVPAAIDDLGIDIARTYLGSIAGPMSSTLVMDLGTSYAVHAGSCRALDQRLLDVEADVRPGQAGRAVAAMTGIISRLTLDGPTSDEVEWLTRLVEMELHTARPHALGHAWAQGTARLHGRRPPDADSDLRRLRRVTPAHLRRLFRALAGSMYVRILGPKVAERGPDAEVPVRADAAARHG